MMEIAVYDELLGRTDTYDLDDKEDYRIFTDLYGEWLTTRLVQLYPGDIIRFKCKDRVDDWL